MLTVDIYWDAPAPTQPQAPKPSKPPKPRAPRQPKYQPPNHTAEMTKIVQHPDLTPKEKYHNLSNYYHENQWFFNNEEREFGEHHLQQLAPPPPKPPKPPKQWEPPPDKTVGEFTITHTPPHPDELAAMEKERGKYVKSGRGYEEMMNALNVAQMIREDDDPVEQAGMHAPLVRDKTGRIVAAARAHITPKGAYLHDIGSIAKGAGGHLMFHTIAESKRRGAKRIDLESLPDVVGFYKHFGFKTARGYEDLNVPPMTLKLR